LDIIYQERYRDKAQHAADDDTLYDIVNDFLLVMMVNTLLSMVTELPL